MISPSTNERLYANKLLNYSCSNQQRPPLNETKEEVEPTMYTETR
jgi:hypothetical protein